MYEKTLDRGINNFDGRSSPAGKQRGADYGQEPDSAGKNTIHNAGQIAAFACRKPGGHAQERAPFTFYK